MLSEIESYFNALKTANKSACTIRNYRKDVIKLIKYFKIESIENIQELTVADYRKFISELNISASSVNACIRNVSAFLHWMQEEGYISDCKFFQIRFGKRKFVKEEKKKKDVLTDEESRSLIMAGKNSQVKFMLAFLLWTGVRNEELRSIKMSDINGEDVKIQGKGSKERIVTMNPILFRMYNEYLLDRKTESEYLFYSNHSTDKMTGTAILNRVHKACLDAGISEKKIGVHRLRGTCLTNIIKESGLVAAKGAAGHSSINTTMIYDATGADYVKDVLKNTTRTFGF